MASANAAYHTQYGQFSRKKAGLILIIVSGVVIPFWLLCICRVCMGICSGDCCGCCHRHVINKNRTLSRMRDSFRERVGDGSGGSDRVPGSGQYNGDGSSGYLAPPPAQAMQTDGGGTRGAHWAMVHRTVNTVTALNHWKQEASAHAATARQQQQQPWPRSTGGAAALPGAIATPGGPASPPPPTAAATAGALLLPPPAYAGYPSYDSQQGGYTTHSYHVTDNPLADDAAPHFGAAAAGGAYLGGAAQLQQAAGSSGGPYRLNNPLYAAPQQQQQSYYHY